MEDKDERRRASFANFKGDFSHTLKNRFQRRNKISIKKIKRTRYKCAYNK